MMDQFRAAAIRERITQASWGFAVLGLLLFAFYYFLMRTDVSDGRPVNAEVLRSASGASRLLYCAVI